MRLNHAVIAVAVGLLLGSTTHAEKVDLTPAQLLKTSTHVVVGEVCVIYSRGHTVGDWKYTSFVAELKIDKVEKGEGPQAGELIYVRYWTRAWVGKEPVPPSTSGHRGLPSEGATVRVYVARNAYDGFSHDNKDGGFNVIGANGFELMKKTPEKKGE